MKSEDMTYEVYAQLSDNSLSHVREKGCLVRSQNGKNSVYLLPSQLDS